jgi:hypothetical protein
MKSMNLIVCVLGAFLFFTACKKIEIEGQELDVYPVVVEAVMSNLAAMEVKLSRAVPFSQGDTITPVLENATVTLLDGNGNSESLYQWESGRFSGEMTTQPGQTYTLRIQTEEGDFEATTIAPSGLLAIDTVTAARLNDTMATLHCHLLLPPSRPVYTRLKVLVDGFLWEDVFIEKTLEQQAGFTQEIELNYIFPGIEVTVEVVTLTKPAFEFYRAIGANALGSNFNPSNAKNPPTNLKGGAIGFFSASLVDTTSLIVW